MCIKKSVGAKGSNTKIDGKVIQASLNLSQSGSLKLDKDLVVDGNIGQQTIYAIKLFQSSIVKNPSQMAGLIRKARH